ncbi:MAG TPA: YciI family protein [Candidatus Binatia bacterium]|nr:YciI family protein [Candidatus Binatia bacterium]
MRYAMLIYETPEGFESRKKPENDAYIGAWRAYHKALVEAGIHAGGDPLQPPETATTVQVRSGRRQVQDGPFANTKEQLGGFTILECPSLDVALEWAARCPAAAGGAVEIRPLAPDVRRRVTD